MAVADELAASIKKVANKKVEIDDAAITLNGPVKTPAAGLFPVPQESEFGSAEFAYEESLAELGYDLISKKANLAHLKYLEVHFRWKKKGGGTEGGKCIRTTGLVRDYSKADFVIWLAADHCRGMSRHEVEALLFHHLCHAGADDEGNRVIKKHDMEEFVAVVRDYGLVSPSLREMGKAMKQMSFIDP